MSSWNQKHIPVPPWCSEAYHVKQLHKGKMLTARGAMHNAIEAVNKSLLWSERWLLRQICYKLNNQLRREKCIARLKQISKCLKALQDMELNKQLAKLIEMIPSRLSLTMENVYLPSKNVVKYVLMRLLGAAALLKQAICYSTSSYTLVTQQLSMGLFPRQMTVMAAAVSRVWVLCRSMITKFCELYDSLYIWLQELYISSPCLISDEDPLPPDIIDYLSLSREESAPPPATSNAPNIPEPQKSKEGGSFGETFDRGSFNVKAKAKEFESCGETVDRDWFNSRVEHRDSVEAKSVQKSPMIKKVRKFLSFESVTPQTSPELKQARRNLTNSELHECLVSVESCGNISQIYLLMAKLSRSHPGVSFRGMKFCLARLKKLKSARNLNKEKPDRIRDNRRLLLRGKKAVRKFLAKNQPNESKEKKTDKTNSMKSDVTSRSAKRKKKKLAKKRLKTGDSSC